MKTLILIVISSLMVITGCGSNIGFSKKSSSSNHEEGNSENEDHNPGDSNPSDGINNPTRPYPGNLPAREQKTFLQINYPKTKVDILFVIDNSSSMANEQKKIASRFSNFINQIKNLNWRIAITTTDPRSYRSYVRNYWSDGRLIPLDNGLYYLSSSMDQRTVERLFSENIQRDENGYDVERGIYATYRTLERGAFGNTEIDHEINQFLRHDADFAVVVISDEDESPNSDDAIDCSGGCSGISYHEKSHPDNLINYVNRLFGPSKIFQFHSIITYTKVCLDGEGHTYGRKYQELSMKTGGVIGDICSNDYTSILSKIGRKVSNLKKTYKLKCKPLDVNKNGSINMKITGRNSSLTIPPYFIQGEFITFNRELEEGHYELTYYCQ